MRAGRAYRLLVRRGGAMPALLASPDRIDHVEVVEVGSGEVVLFWDCSPREASRLARALRPTSPAREARTSSRAGRRSAGADSHSRRPAGQADARRGRGSGAAISSLLRLRSRLAADSSPARCRPRAERALSRPRSPATISPSPA